MQKDMVVVIVLLMLLVIADCNRFFELPAWYALGHPFCALLFAYILWKSTALALFNDGIRWRGTHYPLDLLRANRI